MLNRIAELVEGDMNKIEAALTRSLRSEIPLVNELVTGTIKSGGKRIRPLFLCLSAGMCGYKGELITKVGVIIEHIHTASLLHDDVVDDASFRRGCPSANVQYGNALPILSGDYLYTNAFLSIVGLPGKDLAVMLTNAVGAMSEGEILQLIKTGDPEISMEDYHHIIYCKTGALFSATCGSGALLGEQDASTLMNYGKAVGYAFQMQDDLLDYFGDEESTGKKPGTDLSEKKMTLPLILLFSELEEAEKREARKLFLSDGPLAERIEGLLYYFRHHNIQAKCSATVQFYIDKALGLLNTFAGSPYKTALIELTKSLNKRIS
jgi:octaprenyl-diphosphate synthase